MIPQSPVAVIGWGLSGQAAARALSARGVEVHAFDSRPQNEESPRSDATLHSIADANALAQTVLDLAPSTIVVSPGVPAHSPIFGAAESAGIPLWGEVELAWQLQEAGEHAGRPWLCVTGTNGKTTTVGMLGSMLRASGRAAIEVGNIGTPICEAIDTDADIFAVELSSFQLHTTFSVSPLASVCLNVDSDHLDWHGSAEAYVADKARIYENTQIACVYPAHDATIEKMVENADVREGARAIGITMGIPSPSQFGLVEHHLVDRAFVAQRHKNAQAIAEFSDLFDAYGSNPTPAVVMDALAAAALARAAGVDPEHISEGLRHFRPAGHRRAFISQAADISWIDDSKATNIHAAEASLRGIPEGTGIWIVGGDAKGQVFDDVITRVLPQLRGAIIIGEDRSALRAAFASQAPTLPVVEVDGHEDWMFSVVNEAVALSRPGDTVLLAPACASWDQFDNYGQRGDVFVAAVRRLEEQWRAQ